MRFKVGDRVRMVKKEGRSDLIARKTVGKVTKTKAGMFIYVKWEEGEDRIITDGGWSESRFELAPKNPKNLTAITTDDLSYYRAITENG